MDTERREQHLYLGAGQAKRAIGDIDALGLRRGMVICSPAGWKRFLAAIGETEPFALKLSFFHGYSQNPSWDEIRNGCAAFERDRPEILIAIGGGSSIDVAKAIRATHGENPEAARPAIVRSGTLLAAFATTAGSGSESTPFAVYYTGETKRSLDAPSLLPEYAVADPALCAAMPARLTAVTGFDALSQAVESHWARRATEASRELAAAAIRNLLPHIVEAAESGEPAARLAMCIGANLAGRAIAVTRTTAPHAFSYHLTKRYGIPHGYAAALLIPVFMRVNAGPEAEAETRATMRDLFDLLGVDSSGDAAAMWRRLLAACGLRASVADVGICDEGAVMELIDNVNPDRLDNNPVALSREMLRQVFLREIDAERNGVC